MKRLILATTIIALATTQVAAAPLTPHGRWIADFADDTCTMMRGYGEEGETILGIRPLTGGETFKLLILGGSSLIGRERGRARVSFGEVAPQEVSYTTMVDGSSRKRLTVIRMERDHLASLAAGRMSIELSGKAALSFDLPGISQVLSVLDDCEKGLMKSWGVDPAAIARAPDPGEWLREFSDNDYPGPALIANAEGETSFRVRVDEAGRPADCRIVATSGWAVLDKRTCDIVLQRVRLQPARDLTGSPTESIWSGSVIWALAR